jgi:hypothetical protein
MAINNHEQAGFEAMVNQYANKGRTAYSRLIDDIRQRPVEALICAEGTVYGHQYYTVQPEGGSWLDMETWCLDTFGETGSLWNETKNLTPQPLQRWYMNNRKFWFKEQKDRDWFILRWN